MGLTFDPRTASTRSPDTVTARLQVSGQSSGQTLAFCTVMGRCYTFQSAGRRQKLRRQPARPCWRDQQVRRDLESFTELAHHRHAQLALPVQYFAYPAGGAQKWHEIRPRKTM